VSGGGHAPALVAEAAKVAAFARRDLLILLSYRAGFVADVLQLCAHVLLFGLIGQLVDPALLPAYGGEPTGYLEFVAIGALLSLVFGMLLERVASAIRTEQMIGTLEALLVTPVRTFTVQAGSVAFDAVQVPLRMTLFLAAIAVTAGLDLEASGVLPALVALAAFIPFVWGLGLVSAACIVTFRRGAGITAIAGMALGLSSGAYFPLTVLPEWLAAILTWNPMAITLESMREALIGGEGWAAIGPDVLLVVPMSVLTLLAGGFAFGAAVARERRRGTLGMY
jgi:ABC-2 type transport system permease protein